MEFHRSVQKALFCPYVAVVVGLTPVMYLLVGILHDPQKKNLFNDVPNFKIRKLNFQVIQRFTLLHVGSAAPPYMSPAMKLEKPFRGRRFPTLNDLNLVMTRRIRELNSNGLLDGIKKLPDRWKCVIEARGNYIERRNAKIDSNE